jgi:1-acyl-sn-glycerol-3-phosphate acyltransferase
MIVMMPIAPEAPRFYRLAQRLVQWLVQLLTRAQTSGLEHIPTSGPFIVATNHLHVLDLPVVFTYIPRQLVIFAADKYRGKLGGRIMEFVTKTIFVSRGEVDRRALGEAMNVLNSGGVMAIAPEGTRSRTGGLLKGRSGVVYLAARAGVPIVPAVMWGQEKVMPGWFRLRRAPVHFHVGPPLILPPEAARFHTAELDAYTETLMLTMARMLPREYRGVYADKCD